MAEVPPFEHTPIESIPGIVSGVRNSFLSHKTRDLNFRILQLRKLYWGLVDNAAAIVEALKRDMGRSTHESYLSELIYCQRDVLTMLKHIEKWAKDEPGPDVPLAFLPFGAKVRKDPIGTVLIIGAFNFPFMLTLCPFIGAIAAGCTAILKPSEGAPASAAVMGKIVKDYLDNSVYTVVQGTVPESSALLDQKWDKIFYTGGGTVGTIIAKKAAETLTPVILELGGRNPAFVTKNADIYLTAKRLMWGKVWNAGQACTSQNYTLVDREVLPGLITAMKQVYTEFFPKGAKASPDYTRIAGPRHFQKLKKMLDETRGRIVLGGTMDEADLFFEPTVVVVEDTKDILIAEESFGPLMPLLAVNNLDEAIKIANEVDPTPLALYPHASKAEAKKILDQTRSGGASINDSYMHVSIPTLPFGGVGTSGQGAYHGRASFEAFSHRRAVTTTPRWLDTVLRVRYPPYSRQKQTQYELMGLMKPNFDRNGKTKRGLAMWLFGLGATRVSGAGLRWVLVILVAAAMKQYLPRK